MRRIPKLYADEVLTPEQIRDLGRVAVESGNLEVLVALIIGYVENAPVNLNGGISRKLKKLRSLINDGLPSGDLLDRFNKMYDQGMTSVCNRNILIHGRWIEKTTKEGRKIVTAVSVTNSMSLLTDSLMTTALDLATFQRELDAFYVRYGDQLSTSP